RANPLRFGHCVQLCTRNSNAPIWHQPYGCRYGSEPFTSPSVEEVMAADCRNGLCTTACDLFSGDVTLATAGSRPTKLNVRLRLFLNGQPQVPKSPTQLFVWNDPVLARRDVFSQVEVSSVQTSEDRSY